jgi:hypothetical protein
MSFKNDGSPMGKATGLSSLTFFVKNKIEKPSQKDFTFKSTHYKI